MAYGEEKARDMSRSLLPSTGRKVARTVRIHIHRSARRTARLEVERWERDPEAYDGLPGPGKAPDVKIRNMVWRRRLRDKVNPFIRWATAITRELPRESRLSHVRGRMPQGVIGEHALGHLECTEAFEDPFERERRFAFRRWSPQGGCMDRGEQAELLRAVLAAPAGHRTFNRWLRASNAAGLNRWAVPPPTRVLQGAHDVLPFLDTLGEYTPWFRGKLAWNPKHAHARVFEAMDAFLQAFKKCRGDVEATLKILGWKPEDGPRPPPGHHGTWEARSSSTRRRAP